MMKKWMNMNLNAYEFSLLSKVYAQKEYTNAIKIIYN